MDHFEQCQFLGTRLVSPTAWGQNYSFSYGLGMRLVSTVWGQNWFLGTTLVSPRVSRQIHLPLWSEETTDMEGRALK